MNIHVRGQIEFEKILDYTFTESIALTRQRIAIQQLLDQRGTDDDHKQLIRHLTTYSKGIESILTKLPETTIQHQPCFSWSIDNETVQSACWILEAIMPKVVNYQLHVEVGHQHIQQEQYKDANQCYKTAAKLATETEALTRRWKWKLPTMNHQILATNWHIAQKHYSECLQQLCTIAVGIQTETNDTVMYTLSQRTLRAASLSYMHWKTNEAGSILTLADGLRYMYSAHILWNREEYGQSIHRLKKWVANQEIPTGNWKLLQKEFEKIPFLLQERIHTNNGAYFGIIQAATTLPDIQTIIHTKNTTHPKKGPYEDNDPLSDQQRLESDLTTPTSSVGNP